jgi:nucleoid-associated protein YgaU
VEKLVVLGVLFVITVILVVSMNTRSPIEADDPSLAALDERPNPSERWSEPRGTEAGGRSVQGNLGSATEQQTEQEWEGNLSASSGEESPSVDAPRRVGSGLPAEVVGEEGVAAKGPALLDSAVVSNLRDPSLPAAIPADWDLVALEGLTATADEAVLLYTCDRDETFATLAQRLYGDSAKSELLQRNNEGRRSLRAGSQLFVPVRDDAPYTGSEYVVQDGDSLWEIAKQVYGKGHRWQEIFDSNSALLSTPNALRAGMVLRIP